MKHWHAALLLFGAVCALGSSPARAASLLGPTPYLSFADSPFSATPMSWFYLEDWEGNVAWGPDTPGVSAAASSPALSSTWGPSLIDSVDADDGLINGWGNDGAGHYGEAVWGWGAAGFTFRFDASVLGQLPTHVGIVWTDGAGDITFAAYDAAGMSLGQVWGSHADGEYDGTTAEDRFYGVIDAGGISKIEIWNSSGGIEVDHLQYGVAAPVPEVGLLGLPALLGLGLLAARRRR